MTTTLVRHLKRELLMAEMELAAMELGLDAISATLDAALEAFIPPVDPPASIDEVLGRALGIAEDEWEQDVAEPPGSNWPKIDEYIRGPFGLGWTSADKAHLDQRIPYTRNEMFFWCGAFASFCHGSLGLNPELRRKCLASTLRLHKAIKDGVAQGLDWTALRPGDIAVVGRADSPKGNHIVLVNQVSSANRMQTIEGNARGRGPTGATREGVSRQSRPRISNHPDTYRFCYGVRFPFEAYAALSLDAAAR